MYVTLQLCNLATLPLLVGLWQHFADLFVNRNSLQTEQVFKSTMNVTLQPCNSATLRQLVGLRQRFAELLRMIMLFALITLVNYIRAGSPTHFYRG